MKTKKRMQKNDEYLEYQKIIKIVDAAYEKAKVFTKTDFQKKFERVYSFC